MSTLRYRLLSNEQMAAVGIPENLMAVAVALNDQDEVVALVSFRMDKRGALCDSCTGNCATGGYVYVRPDYRGNNTYLNLFYWLKEQAGIDRNYVSRRDPRHLLIAATYGLAVPKPGSVPEEDDVLTEEFIKVEAMAEKMTSELVFE